MAMRQSLRRAGGCETNPEWDCIFIEKDCSDPRTTPSESHVSHPIAYYKH